MAIRTIRAPTREALSRRTERRSEKGGTQKSQASFQPSPEFTDNLRRAYEGEQVIRVHDHPHTEEMITAALSMFTDQGQAIWPGLSKETPVVFMRDPRVMAQCRTGLMIGIGPADCSINEHHLEEETTTTAMMMKVLAVDDNHPLYPVSAIAYIDDVEASSPSDRLAADVRRQYMLKEKNIEVWHSTLQSLEDLFYDLIRLGNDWQPDLSEQIDFASGFFADRSMPGPIKKALDSAKKTPDSLLMIAERTWRKRGPAAGKQQLREFLTRWEIDCQRSDPAVLEPEAVQASEKRIVTIDKRPVNAVIVDEAKMINPDLLPWLLRFVRSPKSHNADIVIKTGGGKIMIQTNKKTHQRDPDNPDLWRRRPLVDLYGVFETLSKREFGSWHSLRRSDRILSVFGGGTLNYDLAPTQLTVEEVLKVVEKFAWLK